MAGLAAAGRYAQAAARPTALHARRAGKSARRAGDLSRVDALRIHGSNEPWTIGTQVSSGCIRLRNEDVIDLYNRVKVGTKVIVI